MKPREREMVGGCCVCSDERGWPENPLVYCDGLQCTVAVHQACYGIVTVPTGPWFCRKCETQQQPARVKCQLCPSHTGALKPTDKDNVWAHVVCALYIPEVRFGNVTTMEPIILQIPTERFSKGGPRHLTSNFRRQRMLIKFFSEPPPQTPYPLFFSFCFCFSLLYMQICGWRMHAVQ